MYYSYWGVLNLVDSKFDDGILMSITRRANECIPTGTFGAERVFGEI